jgi:hypothetical protein
LSLSHVLFVIRGALSRVSAAADDFRRSLEELGLVPPSAPRVLLSGAPSPARSSEETKRLDVMRAVFQRMVLGHSNDGSSDLHRSGPAAESLGYHAFVRWALPLDHRLCVCAGCLCSQSHVPW